MSDEHWYRNRDWNEEIEARFEQRIARARGQKAQYLMIQGQALIANHPEIAVRLLERSIALNDDFHVNQANCNLALAHLALGEVDRALEAYEAAIEAQLRFPNIQTGAPLDYAFAVALFKRSDRYVLALPILEAVGPSIFPGANFQANAAHALILAHLDRGEEARAKADDALEAMSHEWDAADWAGISMSELRRRLETIAPR
jgi:tetratricopeptide (TPR) repeat protein